MGSFQQYVSKLAAKDGWQRAYPILDGAGKEATADILDGLERPNWLVRKWCVALLDHHGDERCISPWCADCAIRTPM